MMEWVSVAEKPPHKDMPTCFVTFVGYYGDIIFGVAFWEHGVWTDCSRGREISNVTHYMIPEPPKKETE